MFSLESVLKLVITSFKFLLKINPKQKSEINNVKSFLLICPHFSLGQLISNRVLLKSVKENFPNSHITIVLKQDVSEKLNKMLSTKLMDFQKFDEIISTKDVLSIRSKKYDLAFLPCLMEFRALGHLILRFVKSENKIGVSRIDKKENPYKFLFNIHAEINLNDNHIADAFVEMLRPLGIYFVDHQNKTRNIKISDSKRDKMLTDSGISENHKVILINNAPEVISNKWGVENMVNLISSFVNSGKYFFYYIEDKIEPDIQKMLESDIDILHYVDKNNYEELLKIFSVSDLIITCDSDLMHLAGLTNVPQISIFGMGNPFNWAPVGSSKIFIKKSDLINDVSGKDVFTLSQELLKIEKI